MTLDLATIHATPFRNPLLACALALTLLGAACSFGQALWLTGKAVLAQHLIAGAWADTLSGGAGVRPWPWADTWPVARLITPDGDGVYVLEGTHGQALAFGPGHLSASALPGEGGPVIIAGHRDSHLEFLRGVDIGDVIGLEGPSGVVHRYRVEATRVADSRTERLRADLPGDRLVLVTCYPFDALAPGGPLRYVVTASALPDGGGERDGGNGSAD